MIKSSLKCTWILYAADVKADIFRPKYWQTKLFAGWIVCLLIFDKIMLSEMSSECYAVWILQYETPYYTISSYKKMLLLMLSDEVICCK